MTNQSPMNDLLSHSTTTKYHNQFEMSLSVSHFFSTPPTSVSLSIKWIVLTISFDMSRLNAWSTDKVWRIIYLVHN